MYGRIFCEILLWISNYQGKPNFFMIVQWIVFAPIIIPISIVTGAFEGLKKILYQAAADIFQTEEISSS